MQSVTSFAKDNYDPDLIFWDEEDSEDDVEIEDEEMVDRGDQENNLYAKEEQGPELDEIEEENKMGPNADEEEDELELNENEDWTWEHPNQQRKEVSSSNEEDVNLDEIYLDCLSKYSKQMLRRYYREESISTKDLTSKAQIIQAILKYNEEVSEQEKESEEKEESEDNKDEESEKEKEKKPEEQPTLLEGQKGRESCSGLVLRVILQVY